MSRQYPIWNNVKACIYQSNKSFGAKNVSETEVLIGSSSHNSHSFVTHATKRVELEDRVLFKFYVDDVKLKEATFLKDSKGKLTLEKIEYSTNPKMQHDDAI